MAASSTIQKLVEGGKLMWEGMSTGRRMALGTLALFFGFSTAMLGVSGFETSANFVEEKKSGVFPKTLRNMWG